jgi:hypothetical protein
LVAAEIEHLKSAAAKPREPPPPQKKKKRTKFADAQLDVGTYNLVSKFLRARRED